MALQPVRRYAAAAGDLPEPPPGWPGFVPLMELALQEARAAAAQGEAPVGALLLSPLGEILARAANAPITAVDPTAHAEIQVLRQAATACGNYRLPGSILVVTLEPCVMCLGAMIHARIGLLVYGAPDPRSGAVDSMLPGPDLPFFNHRFNVVSGVLAAECGDVLRDFFRKKRRGGQGCG
jgi:tRNA(adenine34) deaminase